MRSSVSNPYLPNLAGSGPRRPSSPARPRAPCSAPSSPRRARASRRSGAPPYRCRSRRPTSPRRPGNAECSGTSSTLSPTRRRTFPGTICACATTSWTGTRTTPTQTFTGCSGTCGVGADGSEGGVLGRCLRSRSCRLEWAAIVITRAYPQSSASCPPFLIRQEGYFLEILGSPLTCFNASQVQLPFACWALLPGTMSNANTTSNIHTPHAVWRDLDCGL